MALENLETFILVAKHLNLTRVAEIISCSPSTITRRLKALEQESGAMLLSVRGKTVELTPQGEQFLPKARALLNQYRETIDCLHRHDDGIEGPVIIGMHQPMAMLLTDLVFARLQRQHPQLRLRFVTLAPRHMSSMEHCDFTITPFQPNDPNLIARPLGISKEYFCASPLYLEQHGVPQHPSELSQHQLLAPVYLGDEDKQWHWFGFDGSEGTVAVDPVLVCDSNQLATKWMQKGFGISRIPEISASRLAPSSCRILFGGQYYGSRELYAVYRSRSYISHKLRYLIDEIANALNKARLRGEV